MVPRFPFTAIVGQAALKRALVLNAVRPDIGGLLIRGERGTAKSTTARALAALLPPIEVLEGCRFGCDPALPRAQRCAFCRAGPEDGAGPARLWRPTPFVDLPVGATEDRVVGTLDIRRVLATGERHFEPGLLAAAHRGILYVDEVNLLDDHVVDVLLDAAAMGQNQVEREGISFSHPARFILVGTMNPEEGDLRPQLTDRFGLAVELRAVAEIEERVEILRRRMAFDADPEAFRAAWAPAEAALRQAILAARDRLPRVALRERDLRLAAEMVMAVGVDGHRAELAILKTAQAQAAFEGRTQVLPADLALAARLALAHRTRGGPFQSGSSDLSAIDAVLERAERGGEGEAEAEAAALGPEPPRPGDGSGEPLVAPRPGAEGLEALESGRGLPRDGVAEPLSEGGERRVEARETVGLARLGGELDRLARRATGRRQLARTETRRGRYVRSRPAGARLDDIAFDASLRAAAIRQAPLAPPARLSLEIDDLQRKVRVRKAGSLILFLVDASWSMATSERLAAAKGAVLALLVDAYQRRDRVGLAVFRRQGTRVVLPFTASVARARRLLGDIAVGGKTPLSHALYTADRLFAQALARDATALPVLVLLSDGAGNISLSGRPPAEEARLLAEGLRRRGVRSIVIDLYSPDRPAAHSPAAELAGHLGAQLSAVAALDADGVARLVRAELQQVAAPV